MFFPTGNFAWVFLRSNGYNEESIDNGFAPCDRNNHDTAEPRGPDPLTLVSDWDLASIVWSVSYLKKENIIYYI
jgi:hypothetical protein